MADGLALTRTALSKGRNMIETLTAKTGLGALERIEIAYALQSGRYTADRDLPAANTAAPIRQLTRIKGYGARRLRRSAGLTLSSRGYRAAAGDFVYPQLDGVACPAPGDGVLLGARQA